MAGGNVARLKSCPPEAPSIASFGTNRNFGGEEK